MHGGYRDEAQALARLAAPRRRRHARAVADPVRHGGRALPARSGRCRGCPATTASHPVRIGNAASGAVAARRLRRGDGRAVPARRITAWSRRDTSWDLQRARWSSISRRSGSSRTKASGRCAAAGATSPSPRSWPGSRSIARSAPRRSSACRHRWSGGARCATRIHDTVCRAASTRTEQRSRSATAATTLDASLLLMPLVGFLPPDDPRIIGTVAAIERELMVDGLVAALSHARSRWTACRRARARSSRAASGSPTTSPAGPQRRGARAVRAAAGAVQRCRPAGRGIRSDARSGSSAISRRRSRIWR